MDFKRPSAGARTVINQSFYLIMVLYLPWLAVGLPWWNSVLLFAIPEINAIPLRKHVRAINCNISLL